MSVEAPKPKSPDEKLLRILREVRQKCSRKLCGKEEGGTRPQVAAEKRKNHKVKEGTAKKKKPTRLGKKKNEKNLRVPTKTKK